MIPLVLSPSGLRLGLIGAGAPALRRLRGLQEAGASGDLRVFTTDPALLSLAGPQAVPRWPAPEEIKALNLLWIAGVDERLYHPWATLARANKVLLNVEDVPAFCDFHSVAEIRRGDLLLTVSTNGQAPGLARTLRKRLEICFPENWAARVKHIAALRRSWRKDSLPMAEISRRIEDLVEERCWLSCPSSPPGGVQAPDQEPCGQQHLAPKP